MPRINAGMFSSADGHWTTPDWLFDHLCEEFYFTLDVCAIETSAKCPYFLDEDSLNRDWHELSRGCWCWMNPPYGKRIGLWLEKAYTESLKGTKIVCLVPSRTDTAWWHDYCMHGEIRFLRGRLCFGGQDNPAPFPSALVIFSKEHNK